MGGQLTVAPAVNRRSLKALITESGLQPANTCTHKSGLCSVKPDYGLLSYRQCLWLIIEKVFSSVLSCMNL